MAETTDPPYPPEMWIEEIPFDVADWGDKPLPYPGGTFATDEEFESALARAKKNLPTTTPMPGVKS